ncbi:hypothetical protein GFH48_06510 [Streptomyces fagopyri]|uniref:Uncharacterized protein n=1 Tax=Streptomyces fagopyri TaxID=2662397 RepID=A0A5Q0L8R0_9ACTN|nr:hypothetical protein [Streptomyces fagopyri]QFZ72957.1 hypothetical protein GFH48_06510 [Streptomyces fagopyri]
MKDNISEEDRHSVLLVRDAMESTVAQLPAVHDLVPAAVTQGRRRRARARLAIAAGSVCVAGAVVAASLALAGGHDARSARPAASGTPVPHESSGPVRPEGYRSPFHGIPPLEDLQLEGLTARERTQRADFQQKAARVLDELLPDSVGLVRPSYASAGSYRGETADGKVFPLVFSTYYSRSGPGPGPCLKYINNTRGGCEHVTLSNGIKAMVVRLTDHPVVPLIHTQIEFSYRHHHVTFRVESDPEAEVDSPVSGRELQTIVSDPRFLDLVRDAIKLPLETKKPTNKGS